MDILCLSGKEALVHLSSEKWDTAWEAAEAARTKKTLTPELVDDVRMALNKL